MDELERDLARLGAELDYPPAPDIAARLGERIGGGPRRSGYRLRRLAVIAAAALVLPAGTVLAASPAAREAALRWIGLRGLTLERTPTAPRVPTGRGPALGQPVALGEARRRAPFPIALPRALGRPDAVYLSAPPPPGGRVTLVYGHDRRGRARGRTGVPLILTELRGDLGPVPVGKLAGPGTRVEPVRVDGARGVWLQGEPHAVFYRDAQGQIRDETLRLATNTLVWERRATLMRLEGHVSRERAVAIAASVR
jgi:hypothetical protein